jgi:hypothetical protein
VAGACLGERFARRGGRHSGHGAGRAHAALLQLAQSELRILLHALEADRKVVDLDAELLDLAL